MTGDQGSNARIPHPGTGACLPNAAEALCITSSFPVPQFHRVEAYRSIASGEKYARPLRGIVNDLFEQAGQVPDHLGRCAVDPFTAIYALDSAWQMSPESLREGVLPGDEQG